MSKKRLVLSFVILLVFAAGCAPRVQPKLAGIITQVELGKDGFQVKLQTDKQLYGVTISKMQAELIGSFDQLVVGTEIEVSGQEIDGIDPPVIVADYVRILGDPNPLLGSSWVLATYNDRLPLSDYQPTLEFETTQVSGTTGCNNYGGNVKIDGDSILFEGIFNTEMACQNPEGIMDQERVFLDLLRTADQYVLNGDELIFYAELIPVLVFNVQSENPGETSLEIESVETVVVEVDPTPIPTPEPVVPDGFKPYQDIPTGISVYIPESWTVTGIIDGQIAILQSYPRDKYVGGELFEAGDTKCDLFIQEEGVPPEQIINQWENDGFTTIISENELILYSGQGAKKYEINSMGETTVMITEVEERVVTLSCFGNMDLFDEIAKTLSVIE